MTIFNAFRNVLIIENINDDLLILYSINLSRLFFCFHFVICLIVTSINSLLDILL